MLAHGGQSACSKKSVAEELGETGLVHLPPENLRGRLSQVGLNCLEVVLASTLGARPAECGHAADALHISDHA